MPNDFQTINEEAGLPSNWVPVDAAPIIPGKPAAPPASSLVPSVPQYSQGSLPPDFQHDSSFVDTATTTPNAPKFGLVPLALNASAVTNAGIQSTTTKIIESTPSTGGGSTVSTIQLVVPNIFTPVTQTVTLPGPLSFSLATELPGTFLGTPSASLPNLENLSTGFQGSGAGAGATFTLTVAPTTATSWAIYATAGNWTPISTPSGFTAYTGSASNQSGFFSALTGTSPISISQTMPINSTSSGVFAVFAGSLPSIVQQTSAAFLGSTPLNKAFTSNNTAGNTIIVILNAVNNSFGPFSLSVSDSAGNSYTTVGYVQGTGVWQPSTLIAIATNIAAGANTVHANITGRVAGGASGLLQIIEYPPLTAAASIPVFRPLISSDIPPISLTSGGNGGTSGILPPGKGGTGADNSTSGGASMFLSQLSVGAAITPTQPDFGDLAGLNKALKYNNVSLVSVGLPSIVALVDKTAQTAAIATTTLYAVPNTAQYRISWNAKVTTAATTSTLGALTITYTDADNVVQTITMAAQNSAGTIETTDTGNSTTTVMLGNTLMLNCRASTNIQYAFAYVSAPAATMAYNLHIRLESL